MSLPHEHDGTSSFESAESFSSSDGEEGDEKRHEYALLPSFDPDDDEEGGEDWMEPALPLSSTEPLNELHADPLKLDSALLSQLSLSFPIATQGPLRTSSQPPPSAPHSGPRNLNQIAMEEFDRRYEEEMRTNLPPSRTAIPDLGELDAQKIKELMASLQLDTPPS
eukprot:TRINITY_DN2197_c0_g1_i2.p1 TRINITY_DN2197_c0_g1~~TRINITY_DN2197_c0_g1_i2.p1  ORF type:complete len:166 (+),score=46.24 TRINITY_DN2197_c0_g1_i2:25-522(+)